mmetsp:Transcript_147215/g.274215  ORF Transcript_147215/g.274215 Transcript_147215/m.274215 type:complete len:109 (-) Transcript_147215:65-391(-)
MMRIAAVILTVLATPVTSSVLLRSQSVHADQGCSATDLENRIKVQNKLHNVCEDMCKTVKAWPKCDCPNFVQPDSTPGVMTWDELLEHMGNLGQWGHDQLLGWTKQAR